MERQILSGLSREWEILHNCLPVPATNVRKPVFSLFDSNTLWGKWIGGEIGEISLSRKLVFNHPWYAVIDVLRHEFAHQLAEQFLAAENETAHGDSFQYCCSLLGIPPRTNDAYPSLDELVFGNSAEMNENDRLMVKIGKLLALAESSNIHEAELAMGKAHELMQRHNVKLKASSETRKYYSITVGQASGRRRAETRWLAGILKDFYFVEVIWVGSYLASTNGLGRIMELSGTRENLRIAHYVYDFVIGFIEREWTVYSRNGKISKRRRNDFAIGLLGAFREKLQGSLNSKPEIADLVLQADNQLQEYLQRRHPRVRSSRQRSSLMDAAIYNAGKLAGKRLVIHKGIETPSESSGKFLEG